MKWLLCLVSSFNLYAGARCLLNVLNILRDSKYGQSTTALFAVILLTMAAGGFYSVFVKHDLKLGFMIAAGPWIVAIVVMVVQLTTGDYK